MQARLDFRLGEASPPENLYSIYLYLYLYLYLIPNLYLYLIIKAKGFLPDFGDSTF
jgi:hypothetical protein